MAQCSVFVSIFSANSSESSYACGVSSAEHSFISFPISSSSSSSIVLSTSSSSLLATIHSNSNSDLVNGSTESNFRNAVTVSTLSQDDIDSRTPSTIGTTLTMPSMTLQPDKSTVTSSFRTSDATSTKVSHQPGFELITSQSGSNLSPVVEPRSTELFQSITETLLTTESQLDEMFSTSDKTNTPSQTTHVSTKLPSGLPQLVTSPNLTSTSASSIQTVRSVMTSTSYISIRTMSPEVDQTSQHDTTTQSVSTNFPSTFPQTSVILSASSERPHSSESPTLVTPSSTRQASSSNLTPMSTPDISKTSFNLLTWNQNSGRIVFDGFGTGSLPTLTRNLDYTVTPEVSHLFRSTPSSGPMPTSSPGLSTTSPIVQPRPAYRCLPHRQAGQQTSPLVQPHPAFRGMLHHRTCQSLQIMKQRRRYHPTMLLRLRHQPPPFHSHHLLNLLPPIRLSSPPKQRHLNPQRNKE